MLPQVSGPWEVIAPWHQISLVRSKSRAGNVHTNAIEARAGHRCQMQCRTRIHAVDYDPFIQSRLSSTQLSLGRVWYKDGRTPPSHQKGTKPT